MSAAPALMPMGFVPEIAHPVAVPVQMPLIVTVSVPEPVFVTAKRAVPAPFIGTVTMADNGVTAIATVPGEYVYVTFTFVVSNGTNPPIAVTAIVFEPDFIFTDPEALMCL